MILVTGGTGYIGSHTVLVLLEAGYDVVVLDNLCNSSRVSIERVQALTGKSVTVIEGDIRNRATLDAVFSAHDIDAVIHFAGLKAVGESVEKPLAYFDNNVTGSIALLEAMQQYGVKRFVFSSSATVYGEQAVPEYRESMATQLPFSPYGQTKLMVEQISHALFTADSSISMAMLRYFNPVGAHPSGQIGEDPQGIPNNLLPFIAQVAVGRREKLSIFGADYDTADGTCLRDYIHVMDLAEGHVRALEKITSDPGWHVWNLGCGQGVSVLEMVRAFEDASGRKIPYEIAPRRAGDLARFWANPEKAAKELGWQTHRDLGEMMEDSWRWQSQNPQGYGSNG